MMRARAPHLSVVENLFLGRLPRTRAGLIDGKAARGKAEEVMTRLSEEHGVIDLSRSLRKPRVGEGISIVPNHCCVVSNMVDEVFGVRGDTIEVVWPVMARGATR